MRNSKTIRLGLMPPLTGMVEMYGTEITRAGQIACQEVNESGGVLGRPLEILIEDDGSLPESAVEAANRLVDHKCVAIIGNLLSNSRIAVAYQVAEPRKIPYLNFSFYEGSIFSRYFFHFAALPNQQIERMIPYMHQFGSRMFFAGNNYEWPRGSIDAAKRILRKSYGQVVGEEYYPLGVSRENLVKLLDHVEESGADVFVPYFAGNDQLALLTLFTERGLKNRVAVVMGHYDEIMASRLPPEVREGFYSSNTYFMTLDTPENRNYLERLSSLPGVTGIWPKGNGILTNFGEGTYLCVKAFAAAAKKAGSLVPEALVNALESVSVSGPQGMVKMNPGIHHAKVNTYLSRCDADGSFRIIERFGAIDPVLPERYRHLQNSDHVKEEDISLHARMIEIMAEAVLLVKAEDGSIIYVNPAVERMFGYSSKEIIGKYFMFFLDGPKETSEEVSNTIKDTVLKKGVWVGEVRKRSKKDLSFWCAVSVSAFTHPLHGEVWMVVNRNIDERKRQENCTAALLELATISVNLDAKALLQRGLDMLEGLTDSRIAFLHFLSEDQNKKELSFWSSNTLKQGCKAMGKSHHSITGIWADSVRHKQPLILNDFPSLSTNRGLPEGHLYLQRLVCIPILDGSKVRLIIGAGNASRNYDESDIKVIKVFGYDLYRILQRKRAEENLRKLDNAIAQAAEMVIITDSDGVIEYANPAVSKETGYSLEELLGKTPHILYSGKHDSVFYKGLWDAIKSGNIWHGRIYNRKKTGEIYEEETTISPVFDENRNITHFVSVKRDITREKRLQQQLIQSEKLSTLGTFVSGIAHELNNPLTSVIGFSEFLLEDKALPEKVRAKLRIIYEQSLRTVEIVKNLLSFSRKSTAERKKVNVGQVIERVLKLHSYRLKDDNVTLNFTPIQKPYFVWGVESELQQVFMNIVINAHQEMVKQAKRILTISIEKRGAFACVAIENTGNAIPSAHFNQLFDPFFTTKEAGEGTGLGLYISHQIVAEHNGAIIAENVGTEGVRFTVSLPLFEQGETLDSVETAITSGIHDLRILVIDDEPSVREYIAELFRDSNNYCLSLESCHEGIKALNESDFDIIISDVRMPGMGGLEFGEWISVNKPEMSRRLILLTGSIEQEVEMFARKHQSTLIIKPVKKDELFSAIASII